MPMPHEAPSAWSVRLAASLSASDQFAKTLFARLTEEQINWQPAPGSWSMGQCLEHLSITNEAYIPPIAAAVGGEPDSRVEQILPGWFGRWFIRSFIEPSPNTKRAAAPPKIRPAAHIGLSVLERFLSGNQSCRELIERACSKDVNRNRFRNPFILGLRFTVGTGLEILASHERRHLLQAERARNSVDFPKK